MELVKLNDALMEKIQTMIFDCERLVVGSLELAELEFEGSPVPKVPVKLPCSWIQQKKFLEPDPGGQDYWKRFVFERVDPFY
jgi:hypothetical protein